LVAEWPPTWIEEEHNVATFESLSDIQTKCEIAQIRYRREAVWRHAWEILLYILGAAIIVFLIVILYFLTQGKTMEAVVTAAGTLIEGAAVVYVINRRNEAKDAEIAALKDVKDLCPAT
jgi:hypothetical protein